MRGTEKAGHVKKQSQQTPVIKVHDKAGPGHNMINSKVVI